MGLVSKQPDDEESLEQITITGFGPLDDDGPAMAEVDLTGWGSEARQQLDERFHLLEAPHAWTDDGRLFVPEDGVLWIQRVMEQVQDERAVPLDPDQEQIGYDLAGWDAVNLGLLRGRLDDERIPFAIEGDELVVLEVDEDRVDAVVDAILEPDAGPDAAPDAAPDPDGGPEPVGAGDDDLEPGPGDEARSELLGDLFLAADRLARDPEDPEGEAALRSGADEVAAHAPPYGVDRTWWRDLADRLGATTRVLDSTMSPDLRDNAVRQSATELRDVLRPLV
jgi:hypothetical protein